MLLDDGGAEAAARRAQALGRRAIHRARVRHGAAERERLQAASRHRVSARIPKPDGGPLRTDADDVDAQLATR